MGIVINLDKAKEITHVKRRANRANEFKPFDEVIAKQIPGNDFNAAEQERQKIRDKYAAIQVDIDTCSDVDSLKLIYDAL